MLKTYIVTFSFADPKYLQKLLRQQLLHILHHSVLYHNLHLDSMMQSKFCVKRKINSTHTPRLFECFTFLHILPVDEIQDNGFVNVGVREV